jgi:hypothetical protein
MTQSFLYLKGVGWGVSVGLLRLGAEIESANNRLDQALERVAKMIAAESEVEEGGASGAGAR